VSQDRPPSQNALEEDYQRAGFGSVLPFGSFPALVVIDVCLAYFQPGSPLYHERYSTILDPLAAFLDTLRRNKVPIIYTTVLYDTLSEAGLFGLKVPSLKVFVRSSELSAFHERLRPQANEPVVIKHYASGFFQTELAEILRSYGIDTLLLAGVSTSGCVRATALDALQLGFAPFILTDLVNDRDPQVHHANLFDLGQKYAELISSSEVIAQLTEEQP
jgi:maleamate amidohydrolase